MPHPKGNMKLSGDVHLPEDEDDLLIETDTSGGSGAADGEGAQRSAATVRHADVVTAGNEEQGRLSLSPGTADEAPANPPRMPNAQVR